MAAAGSKPLFVVAPLVEVASTQGARVRMFHGDVVTEDVSADSIKHLKELGFVSETNPLDAPKPE